MSKPHRPILTRTRLVNILALTVALLVSSLGIGVECIATSTLPASNVPAAPTWPLV